MRPFAQVFNSLLILLASTALSCTQQTGKQVKAPAVQEAVAVKAAFKKGEIIPSVAVSNDPSQSFALYLPKDSSTAGTYPVIIFFDPHGEGTLPLHLYKALAEQYHYILIGSNSAKNGLDLQTTQSIANNLVNEVQARLPVNKNKITLCGFSGGAKVALLSGTANAAVSTVIYCGAVVPVNPNYAVSLLGFAGKRDMNYTDVVSFDRSLANSSMKHELVEWNGKHEFPVADVFKDAFVYLSTGTIPGYQSKRATITPKEIDEEQSFKQKYIDAFQSQGLDWWKKEIAMLNAKKKSNLMYERLLGFISLACYSLTNNALQQNNLDAVAYVLAIYKMADPENSAIGIFTKELKSMHAK